MRFFLAGLVIAALASSAWAQVRGEVESIGYDGWIRPDCWTPMVVRLESQISDPGEYHIEVHQRDLDFDHVVYVKEGITLNGHATQRWEVCFLPSPTNGGLPDSRNNGTLQDLQERLRVYVTAKDGRQLAQLPVTTPIQSLEPPRNSFAHPRGWKLILCVTDSGSQSAWKDYDQAMGLIEQPAVVKMKAASLPQSSLAYQSVDTVVWIAGDARVLTEEGSKQLTALQHWVRQGGSLVVCQPGSDGDRNHLAPLADMLPIVWTENGQIKVSVQDKDNLQPLSNLGAPRNYSPDIKYWDLKGKFPFARAIAKSGAIVDETINWDKAEKDQTPYIARIPYGLGSVTWVAEDLGDPRITGPKSSGWPYIWDAVLGVKNDTRTSFDHSDNQQKLYDDAGDGTDIGYSQLKGVEFTAKGAGLIVLAIFVFIIYWLVAGPGTYLFLAGRKRRELSWPAFAAAAMVATVLTVLVVRLVLRGSAEIHHATDVRMVYGQEAQPAVAYSRVGLYIPRDGIQHIALNNTSSQFDSYLTPLPLYPPYMDDNEFPANLDYHVPVREEGSTEAPAIDVPFRSTLKKLEAKWCGDLSTGIRGNSVRLNTTLEPKHWLQGSLDNLTGLDLRNIYIAFHNPGGEDYILYLPNWPSTGASANIDLDKRFSAAEPLPLPGQSGPHPEDSKVVKGEIQHQWAYYWWTVISQGKVEDLGSPVPLTFPILSFFDRIPPPKNMQGTPEKSFPVYRHGERKIDMSHALMAGEMVVLAQADARPLPFALEVNGDKVAGEGTVFFQFALPIEHVDAGRR